MCWTEIKPEKFQNLCTNTVVSFGFMFVDTHGVVKPSAWKAGKYLFRANETN